LEAKEAEEQRLREEEKERKKQKQKEEIERRKSEGTYMTNKAQNLKAKLAAERIEAMRAEFSCSCVLRLTSYHIQHVVNT